MEINTSSNNNQIDNNAQNNLYNIQSNDRILLNTQINQLSQMYNNRVNLSNLNHNVREGDVSNQFIRTK